MKQIEKKNRNILGMFLFIISLFFLMACSTEETIKNNEAPNVTLSVIKNVDNTLSVSLTATDSDGIDKKEILIKQGIMETSILVTGDSWNSDKLSVGNYTVIGKATDKTGKTTTKQEAISIDGLLINLDVQTDHFEENRQINKGTIVAELVNVNNTNGVVHAIDASSNFAPFIEIANGKILIKEDTMLDYEGLKGEGVLKITSQSSDFPEKIESIINIVIVDKDDRKEDVLIKATHGKAGFAKVDVANEKWDVSNIVEYALDENGNLTDRTFEDIKNIIDTNTSYPNFDGDLGDTAGRIGTTMRMADGSKIIYGDTFTNGIANKFLIRRIFSFTNLHDGSSYTHTEEDRFSYADLKQIIGFAYDELKAKYDIEDHQDIFNMVLDNTGNQNYPSAFMAVFADSFAREQSPKKFEDLYVYLVMQALNVTKSFATAQDAETLVRKYFTTVGVGYIDDPALLVGFD